MPQLELVLAPAGAALALAVAVGAAAVEVDLSGYRFGWRQFAPAFGALAVLAASLPFLSWVGEGQWGLPTSGAEASFAFPPASQGGDYRVLWVGAVGSHPTRGSKGLRATWPLRRRSMGCPWPASCGRRTTRVTPSS